MVLKILEKIDKYKNKKFTYVRGIRKREIIFLRLVIQFLIVMVLFFPAKEISFLVMSDKIYVQGEADKRHSNFLPNFEKKANKNHNKT